ncbi:hypothetical protein [uncultured Capnocytophaga sp.]|uniref:hypothetical protein n=1 Tax=uncultured Capnocytophaga sp. TaxID=159273 RepID=UPI0028EA11AA|nr:hypothetical protein [uncultured Capnocytophaga sp.]
MDLQQLIKNFPWRRFATPYETNANIVKQSIVKILDGAASEKDYQNLIYSFESQAWLIKLSPWGMRFYLALLEEDKADKAILLRDMLTLFEAANYSSQSPQVKDFKATKGKVAKYEAYKEKLFNDAYDGTMDEEFLKLVKSLDRHYYHVAIMELLEANIPLLQHFTTSEDKTIAQRATSLIEAIKHPKIYPTQ